MRLDIEAEAYEHIKRKGEVLRIELSGAWAFKSLELPTLRLFESRDRG